MRAEIKSIFKREAKSALSVREFARGKEGEFFDKLVCPACNGFVGYSYEDHLEPGIKSASIIALCPHGCGTKLRIEI